MHFAPAVRPQLLVLIDSLDDGTRGIASIWRELGRAARARGLFQPSYETVRRLVHALREQRRLAYSRLLRTAVLAVESRSGPRNLTVTLRDLVTGVDVHRRLERDRRARPRAAA